MKRAISIILAGTLSLILAGLALSQVPAALVRSGIVIGNTAAQSSGVHGTAKFSATGGTISGLTVTGCITGVTYGASTGQYLVAVSGCPTNYLVIGSGGDTSEPFVQGQIDPVASYNSSGFTEQFFGGGLVYDAALVFITIP